MSLDMCLLWWSVKCFDGRTGNLSNTLKHAQFSPVRKIYICFLFPSTCKIMCKGAWFYILVSCFEEYQYVDLLFVCTIRIVSDKCGWLRCFFFCTTTPTLANLLKLFNYIPLNNGFKQGEFILSRLV